MKKMTLAIFAVIAMSLAGFTIAGIAVPQTVSAFGDHDPSDSPARR